MGKLAVCFDWPNGNTPWVCMGSVLSSDVRLEPDVLFLRPISPNQDLSANMVIKAALDAGADELFCICADQGVPADVLARMRAHNKDIVGALTATRQSGHHWLVFNFDEQGRSILVDPSEPLQKVDMCPPGCMLIKADALRKMGPPWFITELSADGCNIAASSDFYFFRKAKAAGLSVYVDATIESPHLHEVLLNARSLNRRAPFLIEQRQGSNPNVPA